MFLFFVLFFFFQEYSVMMKKQQNNNNMSPTCGNCIHTPIGHRCCIHPDWPILPDDPADDCEYHFYRVKPEYMKYYRRRPVAPRGWLWDDQMFSRMMSELWAYLKDLQHGIITDNNGGYFTKYPFSRKIICGT